jgi:pilus assembly protein CpaE
MAITEDFRPAAYGRKGKQERVGTDDDGMTRKSTLGANQQRDILLVTQDVELTDRLRQGFADKDRFALRSLKGTVTEIEEFLAKGAMPGILIIDLKTALAEDLAALERLKRTRFSKTPIIAISSYLDQDIVRRLVQIKIDDWLPKDSTFVDIYKSCERLSRAPMTDRREREASCYSFFPAAGGAGNTTLAIQAAFSLGGRKGNGLSSVCLVDLNFQDGSVADYLDIAPAFKVEELAGAPGRLDSQLMEVMLARHSSGLSVLATPRLPGKYLEISEGMIGTVLGLLTQSFDHIVIDLPKNWYPWTDNVVWGSNHVYVVTNFTVPALKHARYLLDAITAKAAGEAKVSVIVNKHREKLFGAGLVKRDAEALLRDWLAGFIPDAPDLVQEAINRGLPMSEISPGGKVEKALERILLKQKA